MAHSVEKVKNVESSRLALFLKWELFLDLLSLFINQCFQKKFWKLFVNDLIQTNFEKEIAFENVYAN